MLFPIYRNSGINDLMYNKVTDGISHKALMDRMKSEKSVEIVGAESNYYKIVGLGRSLKRGLGFKAPDFKKCKNISEMYHLYRRHKINNAHFLARVGFYIDSEYRIMLKAAPEIEILPSALRTFLEEPENVFMSLNMWDGIISANERFQKGLEVPNLGKIFPLYGVWCPTSLDFVHLFDSYLQSRSFRGTAVDLGCGTGVLGMMLATKGMTSFGVDNNFQAAKSANLNAQKLGLNFTAVHGDAETIALPNCDVIVCNPPWIPGKPSSGLDSGNFDPEEKLLQACFVQSRKKLENNGKLLLVYSDLASNLGLQVKGRIEDLCVKHEMVIRNVLEKPFPISLDYKDPFKKAKDESKIFLYEINRL